MDSLGKIDFIRIPLRIRKNFILPGRIRCIKSITFQLAERNLPVNLNGFKYLEILFFIIIVQTNLIITGLCYL